MFLQSLLPTLHAACVPHYGQLRERQHFSELETPAVLRSTRAGLGWAGAYRQIQMLLVVIGLLFSFESAVAQRLTTSPIGPFSQGNSGNWAGYVKTGGPFKQIAGSWTVPDVSYIRYPGSTNAEITGTWIGIGGNSDESLIQLGTTQATQINGIPRYTAWYLLVDGLKNAAQELPYPYLVAAGDRIEAFLACMANCVPNVEQVWKMSIHNKTQGWTWTNSDSAFKYKSSLASAEWIFEAVTRQAGGAISKLPRFGSVPFHSTRLDGSIPRFDLLQDGLAMINSDGAPIAIPTMAHGLGAFAVKQAGIPPLNGYPENPVRNHCREVTDIGELTSDIRMLKGSVPVGSRHLYGFYLPWYSRVDTTLLGPLPRPFKAEILDDRDNVRFSTERNGTRVELDPGYYCLELTPDTGLSDVPFRVNLSAARDGVNIPNTKSGSLPMSAFELGNLSSNGYYGKSRYIRSGQEPSPEEIVRGHVYVLRDWIGPSRPEQWYRFTTRAMLQFQIGLWSPYLGSHASLETAEGTIVAATTFAASLRGQFLARQTFEGQLPAGTYFLRIRFDGVGVPGTPFSLSLLAN